MMIIKHYTMKIVEQNSSYNYVRVQIYLSTLICLCVYVYIYINTYTYLTRWSIVWYLLMSQPKLFRWGIILIIHWLISIFAIILFFSILSICQLHLASFRCSSYSWIYLELLKELVYFLVSILKDFLICATKK